MKIKTTMGAFDFSNNVDIERFVQLTDSVHDSVLDKVLLDLSKQALKVGKRSDKRELINSLVLLLLNSQNQATDKNGVAQK